MNPLRNQITSIFVVLLLSFGGCSTVLGQSGEPINDGPYIVWRDSAKATVFYICQGELVSQEYSVADTLHFTSLCGTDTSTFVVAKTAPTAEPDRFDHVIRILAVSDIHGQLEAFVDFLQKAGVIDSGRHWAYSDGHLVVDGDIVDRGDGVTESLWLVYRLEQEARRAGGRVHFTLGNHEMMVLRGDNRYINEKYVEGTAKKSRILH
ncbi:MAG: metallophosphoesterase, partial [candidate division Zixibacteria bacterium]|nr:metallophosphoesterase [candidate division Zixibacteria bacterium]